MKLGLITSILSNNSMEEVIDITSEIGYECLEVACWPVGKSNRRYSGVTHINFDKMSQNKLESLNNYLKYKNMSISALAFYPNTITDDDEQREINIQHLKKMIENAHFYNTDLVTTFIGRVQDLSVDKNLELVKKIWIPLVEYAENHNVRIAIENCPMLFSKEQWPGGQNLMTSPDNWDKIFSILDSKYFGLNYDPSHFIWQKMDYINPIYDYADKLFHIHFKDIKLYQDKLDKVGTMAFPLEFMAPKLPGLGDVNWSNFVSSLRDIGYNGNTSIEIEDKSFESNDNEIINSLKLSYNYMRQFVI
jgi:sugar phosphate isomerase/epimerase